MDVPYKIILALLATALFMSSPGLANESDIPVVKLIVKDENLRDVLKQISKITGYEILLNGNVGDEPISVILNDPLDEALRKILRRFSYAAVRRKEEKKVIVSIFDDSSVPNPADRESRRSDVAGSSSYSGERESESRNSFYTPPPPLKDILPSDYRSESHGNDLSPSVSGRGTRFIQTTPTIAE